MIAKGVKLFRCRLLVLRCKNGFPSAGETMPQLHCPQLPQYSGNNEGKGIIEPRFRIVVPINGELVRFRWSSEGLQVPVAEFKL